MSDEGSEVARDPQYARDVALYIILPGLGKVRFEGVMHYQEDSRQIWRFLQQ